MQSKNELILNKLIELGYLTRLDADCLLTKTKEVPVVYEAEFDEPITSDVHCVIFNALVSECAKHRLEIVIEKNVLAVVDVTLTIFAAEYTRESVADAFMKVTGISEVSEL